MTMYDPAEVSKLRGMLETLRAEKKELQDWLITARQAGGTMSATEPYKGLMTIKAARNGFSVKTRSGTYVYRNVEELLREIKAYAEVMLREAQSKEE